jgi:prepilin-type N-terminal cleavage/methylation domain-containing protein
MHNFTTLKTRAFTLIELLVVIAIIGLLASVVLASLQSARASARDAARVSAVKELQKALELYRNTNRGNYPCLNAGCTATGGAVLAILNAVTIPPTSAGAIVNAALSAYYTPTRDTSYPANQGSIMYMVGGDAITVNRSGYAIALRREVVSGNLAANAWCKVEMGVGYTSWSYPPCF